MQRKNHPWTVFTLSLTLTATVGACEAEGPDDLDRAAEELALEDEELDAEDEELDAEDEDLVAEEEEDLDAARRELDPADELLADIEDPTSLVVPNLIVEFTGCNGWSPTFLVNWWGSGGGPATYDVDLKMGFGSFQSYYDGPSAGGGVYWGSQNRNDTFRVRVCANGSCGAYVSRSTGSIDCGLGDPL